MAVNQRALKRGDVRTFDESYNKGFKTAWASEVDADFEILFNAITPFVATGSNPPANPAIGQLWWRSDPDGVLYIYYNDGTSTQWVPAALPAPTTTTVLQDALKELEARIAALEAR